MLRKKKHDRTGISEYKNRSCTSLLAAALLKPIQRHLTARGRINRDRLKNRSHAIRYICSPAAAGRYYLVSRASSLEIAQRRSGAARITRICTHESGLDIARAADPSADVQNALRSAPSCINASIEKNAMISKPLHFWAVYSPCLGGLSLWISQATARGTGCSNFGLVWLIFYWMPFANAGSVTQVISVTSGAEIIDWARFVGWLVDQQVDTWKLNSSFFSIPKFVSLMR